MLTLWRIIVHFKPLLPEHKWFIKKFSPKKRFRHHILWSWNRFIFENSSTLNRASRMASWDRNIRQLLFYINHLFAVLFRTFFFLFPHPYHQANVVFIFNCKYKIYFKKVTTDFPNYLLHILYNLFNNFQYTILTHLSRSKW